MGKSVVRKKKVAVVERAKAFIAGVQQSYTPTSTLLIRGVAVLQPAVIAALQGPCDSYAKVVSAQNALLKAVAEFDAQLPNLESYLADATIAVRADKGNDSPDLRAFGIEPPKARTPISSTTRVLASAKSAATRKARGTLGKRQREDIVAGGKSGLAVLTPDGSSVTLQPAVPPVEPVATEPVATGSHHATPPAAPNAGPSSGGGSTNTGNHS